VLLAVATNAKCASSPNNQVPQTLENLESMILFCCLLLGASGQGGVEVVERGKGEESLYEGGRSLALSSCLTRRILGYKVFI
jgi:hypothetical protein